MALKTAEKKGEKKAKIEIAKNLLDILDDEIDNEDIIFEKLEKAKQKYLKTLYQL